MSEDVYAKPELNRKVRFQESEMDKDGDVNLEISDGTIYDNYLPERTTPPKSQDNTTEIQQQASSIGKGCGKNHFRDAAVLLGLMCLVFLVAAIVLATLWAQDRDSWQTERSQRGEIEKVISEMKSLSDNLTVKTSLWEKNLWSNLSHDRDELKTIHSVLKDTVYNLTQKTSQLEKVEDILAALKDNLTSLRGELLSLPERAQCPANWIKFDSSCYFISTSRKSWTDSQEMCERQNASLVVISTFLEQLFISSLDVRTWIGLSEVETTTRDWRWVNGAPLTTAYWASSQPDNKGKNEKCIEILTPKDFLQNWNDHICSETKQFVCEKRLY